MLNKFTNFVFNNDDNDNDGNINNNIPMNNGANNGHGNQIQNQTYMSGQELKKMTVQRQTFIEQINDTYDSIMMPAEMCQNKLIPTSTVDRLTDGAILTLDMFIASCNELLKERDINSINIGKKKIHDKWNELKLRDPQTFKLTLPYFQFLLASLNGQNRRYNMKRGNRNLFNNNAADINKSVSYIITNSQNFSKQQKTYFKPAINKKLKLNHDKDLKDFNKNQFKYNNCDLIQNYKQPNISSLYFTNSGRHSKFQSMNADNDQKDMMDDLVGIDYAYDKIPNNIKYDNIIVNINKLSSKAIPAKIIYPNNSDKLDKIHIRCAIPYNNCVYTVPVNSINFNIKQIIKTETKYIKKYGKLGDNNYKSIKQQQQQVSQMDIDDL